MLSRTGSAGFLAVAFSFALSATAADLPELEHVVIAEAQRLVSLSVSPPPHCPTALPGGFAERAEPALVQLNEAQRLLEDEPAEEKELFRNFAERGGTIRATELRRSWLKVAAPAAASLRGALCSAGTVPAGLTLFGGWQEGPQPYSWIELQEAPRVWRAEAWLAPPARQKDALRLACLDSLAVARLANAHSLIARMVSSSVVKSSFEVCVEAINRADRGELELLSAHLRPLVRRSSFADVLGAELVFGQLAFFDDTYSKDALAALPKEASALLGWGRKQPGMELPVAAGARRWLFGKWARSGHFDQLQSARKVVIELPPDAAVVALNDLGTPVAYSLMGFGDGEPARWGDFYRRDLETGGLLQMLWLGAQLRLMNFRTGGYPRTLDQLGKVFDAREAAGVRLLSEDGPLIDDPKIQLYLETPAFPENPPPVFRVLP